MASLALIIGIVFGFGFGTLAALRQTTWIDRAITGVMTVFSVMPALALSFDTVSDVARQLRAGLIAAYRENYVTGAVDSAAGPPSRGRAAS